MSGTTLYQVRENRRAWLDGTHPDIDGEHPWKLPSIKCPTCGIVSGCTDVVYPWVNLSSIPNPRWYKGNAVCVMSPDEIAVAVLPIRRLVGEGLPLPPGTFLGAFKGRHTAGTLEDFYLYLDQRLIARSKYERLRERGALGVGATPASIRGRRGRQIDYLELHLAPRVRLAAPFVHTPGVRHCEVCGFDQRPLPNPLVVARESIPPSEELFQLVDRHIMLATSKFVEAVKSLGLTGIEFEPVEVA